MKHETNYLALDGITTVRKIIDIPILEVPDYLVALQSALHLMEKQFNEIVFNIKSEQVHKEHQARYQNLKELFNSLWQDKNL
jgi:hypothetical protein